MHYLLRSTMHCMRRMANRIKNQSFASFSETPSRARRFLYLSGQDTAIPKWACVEGGALEEEKGPKVRFLFGQGLSGCVWSSGKNNAATLPNRKEQQDLSFSCSRAPPISLSLLFVSHKEDLIPFFLSETIKKKPEYKTSSSLCKILNQANFGIVYSPV